MAENPLPFLPYSRPFVDTRAMQKSSADYLTYISSRRSLREFSSKSVPKQVIENLILSASSAPSGAHKQPWTFCAVGDASIKKQIREAAEIEEKINYTGRMTDIWLEDLEPFGTNWQKPFLEIAPWLLVVFKKSYHLSENGTKKKNYYVNESVGIATGFLLTAIHQAGLVALTHTPSPMNFLEKILQRPANEKAFLLIPVGYPAPDARVPNLTRKGLEEVAVFY